MFGSTRTWVFLPAAVILLAAGYQVDARQSSAPSSPPPFTFDAKLKPAAGTTFAQASGLVKFRQPEDRPQTVELEVSVGGLGPNAHYQLQRAVDQVMDGACTGTDWLTLGADNNTPRDIVTDAAGDGQALLTRSLSAFPRGSTFDIHFRVVDAGGAAVLESGCSAFAIR